MPNPLDAPDAVAAAAEPLEELLDDNNHVSIIELFPVVPVTGMTSGHDWMNGVAQALDDATGGRHQVGTPVVPLESPQAWRDVLRGQVTAGIMQPACRYADPDLRTPAEIRRAGELADGIADLIEAHLGPVRASGDVGYLNRSYIWWRNVLLVTDEWATILHLALAD
ncbi:hypothetical protein [Kitasatospora sp. NPDC047058]|uniref:hypothetical protein n=1 Tax=Kitasatospora sp. NPDC047058 TaxID=3155620 RepID=UPI0033DE694D